MKQETLPAVVLKTSPLWRVQIVRVLQIIGVAGGFIGGADFLQLVAIMPPDVAAWLLVSGPAFAAGSKPLILLIGDLLDDGERNDSFKIPAFIFLAGCAALAGGLALQSCASFPGASLGVTPDGCALVTYRDARTGQSFKSGACVGADGLVAQYVTEWETPDGFIVRAIRPTTGAETVFWYQEPSGLWVRWSQDAGVEMGPMPTASGS